MLCYLGDVTGNAEHYHRAWKISQGRSSRSQRSLAYFHFSKSQVCSRLSVLPSLLLCKVFLVLALALRQCLLANFLDCTVSCLCTALEFDDDDDDAI